MKYVQCDSPLAVTADQKREIELSPRNGNSPQRACGYLGQSFTVSGNTMMCNPTVSSARLSNDPQFEEKVRDVTGLYLNPPGRALVLCVDEKSQIQTVDRTAPILPLRPGLPERQTHDYKRHGTTTLFAAFNILNGKVIGTCQERYRSREFIQFLNHLERQLPGDQEAHLIMDNYCTHKSAEVQRWLTPKTAPVPSLILGGVLTVERVGAPAFIRG